MGIRELRANIVANASGFISELNRASQAASRLGSDTARHSNAAGSSIGALTRSAAGLAAAYVGFDMLAQGVGSVATSMVMGNADMETYQNTLSTLLKSNEKGKEMLDWATEFAATTPFEIPEIVDATSKLTAYGMNAKDVMTDIGNMASIMGKPLDQAVEAVADAQTGELERLKEFGITKQMLVDKAQQLYKKELVNSKGQITDQQLLNDSLMAIMRERYSGGMELASTSFKGMLSNFQDSLNSVTRALGEPLFKGLKNVLSAINPIMSELVAMFQGKSNDVKGAFEKVFGKETVATAIDIFTKIGNVGKGAFDLLRAGWEVVSPIFAGIGMALAPVGAAFLTIASEVGKFISKMQEMGLLAPLIAGIAAGIGAYLVVVRGVFMALQAWNAVTKVAMALQAAFNVVMSLNPIGIVIGLIVGLGVAIYMAYQKSETFRNILNTLWDGLKAGWEAVSNFFMVTIPAWWQQAVLWFEQGKQWVSEKWNSIWTACVEAWNSFVMTIQMYWALFTTTISLIWDAVKTAVVNAWNTIWTAVMDAWNAFVMTLQAAWAGFTAIVMAIWTAISAAVMMVVGPMWDGIKNAFEIGKTTLMAVWDAIKGFAIATWENIKLFVLGIVSVFLGILLGDWEGLKLGLIAIWDAVKSQAQLIWNTLCNIVKALIDGFIAAAKAVWEGFKGSLINIWNAIKTGVVNIATALGNALTNAWNSMKQIASSTWEWIKSTVVNLVNNLKEGAINAINNLKTGAVNAWNNIKDSAVNTWNNIKSSVINAANSLKEGAINAFNNLKSTATNVVNNTKSAIVNGFNSAKDGAVQAVSNMYNSIKTWFNNIWNSAKEAANNLKSAWSNINLTEIGRNIIQGLYNGITGMASKVINKAKEIANSVKDNIKGVLGIASPSKVMKKYGNWTGEGLVIGLDKTKSMVAKSARGLADAMASPIEATTDMNATGELRTYNTMEHIIDFKNVPQGMTKEELIDGVSKSLSHPKVLRALDKATGENRLAFQRTPKGAM